MAFSDEMILNFTYLVQASSNLETNDLNLERK